jgi:sensor histidine kinase YesM
MRNQWYTSKWAVISFHVIAWLFWFSLPTLIPMLFHRDSDQGPRPSWDHIFNWTNLAVNGCWVVFFYLNADFLIPRFFNKRKTWQYVSILVGLCAFLVVLLSLIFQLGHPHKVVVFRRESLFSVLPFIFLWSVSSAYRIVSDNVKMNQLIKDRENENLKTELSFLRSQVSPHFLFNVLNNMVALARLKSDKLEPSLIKLSGLMRYMLYESDEEKVPLSKEIEYVSSYIDLQKLRYGKDMQINVNMDGQGEYHLIEPMLLIPFIENAFKHGTGMIRQPEIDISLEVNKGVLDFRVNNKYNGESAEIKDKISGIGLNNVIRRLNLLYDKKHILSIDKENGWFKVSLQLKLQ